MGKTFYITTAIDYVNGSPHLGHAYEKTTTDVIARWKRLQGEAVFFLTGTDEHGVKVQKTAEAAGATPQEFVDGLVPAFQEAWAALDVVYDRFIRTTDADHAATVSALLGRIRDRGYLEEQEYLGWYCEGCEGYKTERELEGGKCPLHPTRQPVWLEETNLFFKLSAFRQPLLDLYEANPDWLRPASRRNEILAMLQGEVADLSISRDLSAVSWGIPISFRPDSVIYVWFDALINYLTGAGFGSDPERFERLWPADVHVIGKDVTRFHCIIWPAMLLAAGVELPRSVFAHGFVLVKGGKLSKSSASEEQDAVDLTPAGLARAYGPDAVRWFLTHEITYGRDGEFDIERFEAIYAAHLANGYGNLVSRSVNMAAKYFGGVPEAEAADAHLQQLCAEVVAEAGAAYDELRLNDAAASAWRIVEACNKEIQEREPFRMAKDPDKRGELANLMTALLESVRIASLLLSPVLTRGARQALAVLGAEDELELPIAESGAWGRLPAGRELSKPKPIYPRLG